MQTTTDLPARPDTYYSAPPVAPAPRQQRRWPLAVGGAVAMFIALGILGSVMGVNDAPVTTPITVAPADPVETGSGLTYQEAATQAVPILGQVEDELGAITQTSAISADIRHLENTANLLDEAGALFEGLDETQVLYLTSAADHMRTAALTWPDRASRREINAATDDLVASREALPVPTNV